AWSGATVPFPHEFIVDLGTSRSFHGFSQLPRQDASGNGRILAYRFYGSEDGVSWGNPLAQGNFSSGTGLKKIMFTNMINRAPVIGDMPTAFSVSEAAAPGALVGTVEASDPNAEQTVTYSMGSGNAGGAFSINPATGEIRVAGLLNYETQPVYNLQIMATDSGSPPLSSSKVYPITIGNVIETNREAVTIKLASQGGAYEGHGNPALIGFTADPDQDGVTNAIELLLGTDPSRANAQPPIRPVTIVEGGQTRVAYEFDLAADSGLIMRCSGSSDMLHWEPLVNPPSLVSSQNNIKTWRVRENEPMTDSPARFIRLEVAP
ncbi:MAG: hypothetical protein EOP85_16345, partial [Verrucomicrobiaceae bacterium]